MTTTGIEHDWFKPYTDRMWQSCRLCGIVRRADDNNKPCKGVVRVALRANAIAEGRE